MYQLHVTAGLYPQHDCMHVYLCMCDSVWCICVHTHIQVYMFVCVHKRIDLNIYLSDVQYDPLNILPIAIIAHLVYHNLIIITICN